MTEGGERRRDMFGASGFGDTSGFGGLVVQPMQLVSTPKPYGSWFDEATSALEAAYPNFSSAVEAVRSPAVLTSVRVTMECAIPAVTTTAKAAAAGNITLAMGFTLMPLNCDAGAGFHWLTESCTRGA